VTLHIRPAELVDATAFSKIGAATFALACPPSTPEIDIENYIASELTQEKFEGYIVSESTSLFAAVINRHVVGYLMLCRDESPPEILDDKSLELRRLYVLPKHHGTGVAQALMAQALSVACSEARRTIWLGVSKNNGRGLAFYQKNGFSIVGEQRFPVGSNIHEDFIMSRKSRG